MKNLLAKRMIRSLKKRGKVVGYLVDGIHDTPSLHSADEDISAKFTKQWFYANARKA